MKSIKRFFNLYYEYIFKIFIIFTSAIVLLSFMLLALGDFQKTWLFKTLVLSSLALIVEFIIFNHLKRIE